MTDLGPDPQYSPPVLPAEQAAELARTHGLRPVGTRPAMGAYLADLWRYRHLMWEMAKGEFVAEHQDNYLGLLWSVLNPLLLAGAYYLIFGLLIGTRGGIENYVAFLTIGLFVFTPMAGVFTSGSRALLGRLGMIRSLTFPRVLLPVTVALAHFLSAVPAFLVLLVIALLTGERPTLSWLLYPVALLVVVVMSVGIAMIGARVVHAVRDTANLLPLTTRLLRYVSGIFFSVEVSVDRLTARFSELPDAVGLALEYQPVAVVLTMTRETLMHDYPLQWETWAVAAGWAVLLLIVGFVVFWRGEGTYGRA